MSQGSDRTQSTPSTRRVGGSEELSGVVIGAAIRVHRTLGPGLLESAYEACLAYEIVKLGIPVRTQVGLPIVYDDVRLDVGYRLDMVVDGQLVIEIKSIERLERVHLAQMMTYLRLSGHALGLLLNFNSARLTDGVRRVVRGYRDPPQS